MNFKKISSRGLLEVADLCQLLVIPTAFHLSSFQLSPPP